MDLLCINGPTLDINISETIRNGYFWCEKNLLHFNLLYNGFKTFHPTDISPHRHFTPGLLTPKTFNLEDTSPHGQFIPLLKASDHAN